MDIPYEEAPWITYTACKARKQVIFTSVFAKCKQTLEPKFHLGEKKELLRVTLCKFQAQSLPQYSSPTTTSV